MRRVRSVAGVVVLGTVLAACGSQRSAPTDPAQAAAVASVQRFADTVESGNAAAGCRAVTAATRRALLLTGPPGATCATALVAFLRTYGLRTALPAAGPFVASGSGDRVDVRAKGVPPLSAVLDQAAWRISLIGVPGVRGDVAAARACGRYFDAADGLPLPPFAPAALAERLRGESRLVGGLRRRLVALPPGGPPRPTLPALADGLGEVRAQLRRQASRVEARAGVVEAIQASAQADVRVRALLADAGVAARVACPLDAASGPQLAERREQLDGACASFVDTLDRLAEAPANPDEAQALLLDVDVALAALDKRLRRAPVATRLRLLRKRARGAVAALRREVAAIGTTTDRSGFTEIERRIDGYGAQIDAALLRLGGTCVTSGGPGSPPTPSPSPSPRKKQPAGTVLS